MLIVIIIKYSLLSVIYWLTSPLFHNSSSDSPVMSEIQQIMNGGDLELHKRPVSSQASTTSSTEVRVHLCVRPCVRLYERLLFMICYSEGNSVYFSLACSSVCFLNCCSEGKFPISIRDFFSSVQWSNGTFFQILILSKNISPIRRNPFLRLQLNQITRFKPQSLSLKDPGFMIIIFFRS